jgi:hypothetical protein
MQDTTFLFRLSQEEKAALFETAKLHNSTASAFTRQIIRGAVLPKSPHLVSNQRAEERVA